MLLHVHICLKQGDSPTVNPSIPSFPRIPPCIPTIYWSSHFTVGGWKAEEGSLFWFTSNRAQSETLSACGCLRQWEVHVFVNVLQASSCWASTHPEFLASIFSQRNLQSQCVYSLKYGSTINFMSCLCVAINSVEFIHLRNWVTAIIVNKFCLLLISFRRNS